MMKQSEYEQDPYGAYPDPATRLPDSRPGASWSRKKESDRTLGSWHSNTKPPPSEGANNS